MHSFRVFSILIFFLFPVYLGATVLAAEPATIQRKPIRKHAAKASDIRSDKLKELNSKYLESGDIDGFWVEVKNIADSGGYPFVEDVDDAANYDGEYVRVTFLHKKGIKEPENVLLFANINHVVPQELLFENIGRSGVYFKTVEVPRGSRFEYRIIENDPLTGIFAGAKYGTRMHLLGGDPDPLNSNKKVYKNDLGESKDYIETWVELSGASPQPYVKEQGNPKGKLTSEFRQSKMLGYSRKLFTYLPPNYDPKKTYPLLIIFDGEAYFSKGSLGTTIDNLIADGSVEPLIVLGINAGTKNGQTQRYTEFACDPMFSKFIDKELLPWFTSRFNIDTSPERRIVAGSSFGGLFAAYFAFNNPETVSNVLTQSGSYHWGKPGTNVPYGWLVNEFAFKEKKPIRIYMEVGLLEGEYSWRSPLFPHQILSHRHFKTILEMRKYDVAYHEYPGGHEMLSWKGGIANGLKRLFAGMRRR